MISKSSLQAIKALVELAKLSSGEYAGASHIAQKVDAPANYLGKVLQQLAVSGIVTSQKGKGGGFRLNKHPAQISIYDVIQCLEDVDRWSSCLMGRKQCTDVAPCSAHVRWKTVREINLNFLKEVRLDSL